MDNPNKGYDKARLQARLREVIRGEVDYYLAQYGCREWIADAIDEVAAEATGGIRNDPYFK
jgi:hypothetical protein